MTYVFLSSTDSLEYHPDNTSFDFTVELSHEIKGSHKVALCEIDFEPTGEDLYIFCDVCDDSHVLDRSLPLLRITDSPGEFSNLYFHNITRSFVQRIRIYIRNQNLSTPSTSIGPVRCTLVVEAI